MADIKVEEYSTEHLRELERSFRDYLRDDHPTAEFRKPEDIAQARQDLNNVNNELSSRGITISPYPISIEEDETRVCVVCEQTEIQGHADDCPIGLGMGSQ